MSFPQPGSSSRGSSARSRPRLLGLARRQTALGGLGGLGALERPHVELPGLLSRPLLRFGRPRLMEPQYRRVADAEPLPVVPKHPHRPVPLREEPQHLVPGAALELGLAAASRSPRQGPHPALAGDLAQATAVLVRNAEGRRQRALPDARLAAQADEEHVPAEDVRRGVAADQKPGDVDLDRLISMNDAGEWSEPCGPGRLVVGLGDGEFHCCGFHTRRTLWPELIFQHSTAFFRFFHPATTRPIRARSEVWRSPR